MTELSNIHTLSSSPDSELTNQAIIFRIYLNTSTIGGMNSKIIDITAIGRQLFRAALNLQLTYLTLT